MGTSTARRAPTTRAWRQAKITAVRYLSPENPHPVEAREVVARYVAALKEGSDPEGGALAAFPLTRKLAQDLGEFCTTKGHKGPTASGLDQAGSQAPLTAAHMLASTWLEEAGGLEEAALRPALVQQLTEVLHHFPEPSQAVRKFLAAALYHRLIFDLGEPLEGAAARWRHLANGLARIEREIANAAEAQGSMVPSPEDWQGLEGWLWVSQVLENMLNHFTPLSQMKK